MTFFHFVLLQLPSSIVDALTDPELMDALKQANNKRTHTVGLGEFTVKCGDQIFRKKREKPMQWWKGGSFCTPPKTKMEPENDGFHMESPFPWVYFQVYTMLIFFGVYKCFILRFYLERIVPHLAFSNEVTNNHSMTIRTVMLTVSSEGRGTWDGKHTEESYTILILTSMGSWRYHTSFRKLNEYMYIYYIPRAQMTSIFEGQPLKTRPFPSKARVIWVLGV